MTKAAMPKLARTLLAAATIGATLLSLEGRAHAQDVASPERFGQKGQFAVTAEDLMGVYADHTARKDQFGYQHSWDNTRVSLLFATHGGGNYMITAPTATVGFHYFVIDGLSVGGNLGYESRSGSISEPRGNGVIQTQTLGTGSTFIFEPKVGYELALSDVLGFWFRGGLSVGINSEYPDAGSPIREDRYTYWLFSADVLFTIMPVEHVGFYVGPGLDISFAGTYTNTDDNGVSRSFHASYRRIKLGSGLIAWF